MKQKKLNGSQEAKGFLLEINIYTKTRRISFQTLHQDKDIMRSSFNHCIKTFGVNYKKSRELQGKTKKLETDKAKDPSKNEILAQKFQDLICYLELRQFHICQICICLQLTFPEFHFETEAKVDFPSACL